MRKDREFITDCRMLGPDGSFRRMAGRFVILRDDQGRVSGHLGTVTDTA